MGLKDLTKVHAAWDTQRVQNDVNRSSVLHERHILNRKNLCDNTLVAVTASKLVTLGDLALLGDVNNNSAVHPGSELVAVLCVKYLDANDGSALAVWDLQRGVAHLSALLVEDRAKQSLLCRELSLTLRGYLSDQDVSRANLCTNTDDAHVI